MTSLVIATLPESETDEEGGRVIIITGDRLERVRATRFPKTAIVQSYMMGHVGPITAAEELKMGSGHVISASMDGMLGVWDVCTGKRLLWACIGELCSLQVEEVKALDTVDEDVASTFVSTSISDRTNENDANECTPPPFVVTMVAHTQKKNNPGEGVMLACVVNGFRGIIVVVLEMHPSANTIAFLGKVPLDGEATDVAFLGDELLVTTSKSGSTSSCDSVCAFSIENDNDKGKKGRTVSTAAPNSQAGKVAKLLSEKARSLGLMVQSINEKESVINGLQRKRISEARSYTGWNTYSL